MGTGWGWVDEESDQSSVVLNFHLWWDRARVNFPAVKMIGYNPAPMSGSEKVYRGVQPKIIGVYKLMMSVMQEGIKNYKGKHRTGVP